MSLRKPKLATPYPFVLFTIASSFAILVIAFLITSSNQGLTLTMLMSDPVTYAKLPRYVGFFSNLGILLWCSTATLCLFCSFWLAPRGIKNSCKTFLFYGGLISLFFAFDDLFLFHESGGGLFKKLLHMPEEITFMIYGIVSITYLTKFRRTILEAGHLSLLVTALALFSTSILVDIIPASLFASMDMKSLLEDGAKFLGIVSWFCYFLTICWSPLYRIANSSVTNN